MSENPTLLTIDDEEPFRRSIRGFFEDSGFEVWEAANGQEGLAIFRDRQPQVVLVDLGMPGISGLEVIQTLAAEAPEVPVVVLSGTGVITDAIGAIRKGAWDYVMKPVADMAALEHVVKNVQERAKLRAEKRRYQERLEAEVSSRTRELSALNERLTAVVRSARAVMACASTETVGRQLLAEFASNMAAGDGRLYLVENSELVLKHALRPPQDMAPIPLPVPATSLLGRALNNKVPVLVPSITAVDSIFGDGGETLLEGSFLAFPFFDSAGSLLGIAVLSRVPGPPLPTRISRLGQYWLPMVARQSGRQGLRNPSSRVKRSIANWWRI